MTILHDSDAALWPEFIQVGDILYPPGGTFGPRQQNYTQLVMIHTGEMTVWIDGVRKHAPAATVSILFPGHEERFAFATDSDTWHSFIHMTVPNLPDSLDARLRRLPWPLPLSQAMADLTFSALALRTTSLSTAQAMLKALGAEMLWRYIGEGERLLTGNTSVTPHPAIERVRQYIQSHLGEPLTLESIASVAAVSPSHLIRLFQTEMNTTPIAYLWERRVAMGIELLENTGLSVGMIAERCGFQTSYHFSRRIRQATKLSPLEVRRRAWQRG
jgi:AraC-like DNA-binding protein